MSAGVVDRLREPGPAERELEQAHGHGVRAAVATLDLHRAVSVDLSGLDEALRGSPVPMSTMGRALDADPAYFLAAAAAGRHAAALLA